MPRCLQVHRGRRCAAEARLRHRGCRPAPAPVLMQRETPQATGAVPHDVRIGRHAYEPLESAVELHTLCRTSLNQQPQRQSRVGRQW
eukprot:3133714-Prymnesium_polylepis.1